MVCTTPPCHLLLVSCMLEATILCLTCSGDKDFIRVFYTGIKMLALMFPLLLHSVVACMAKVNHQRGASRKT